MPKHRSAALHLSDGQVTDLLVDEQGRLIVTAYSPTRATISDGDSVTVGGVTYTFSVSSGTITAISTD